LFGQFYQREPNALPLHLRRSPYFQSLLGDVNNLNCLIVVITEEGTSAALRIPDRVIVAER